MELKNIYGVGFSSVGELVTTLLNNAYFFLGIVVVLFLILGGLSIIIGAGTSDQGRIERGGRMVKGAVMGLIVVFLSFFIIRLVEVVTGVSITNLSP